MASLFKVALDTNMLTAVAGMRIDVLEEIRKMLGRVKFVMVRQSLDELERLSKGKGKEAKKAQFAKKVVQSEKIEIIDSGMKSCDDALLGISSEAIVATNDRQLRRRIRESGGKVIFIRQEKFIEMEA